MYPADVLGFLGGLGEGVAKCGERNACHIRAGGGLLLGVYTAHTEYPDAGCGGSGRALPSLKSLSAGLSGIVEGDTISAFCEPRLYRHPAQIKSVASGHKL